MFKDIYKELDEYTSAKTTENSIKESYEKEKKYEKQEQKDLYGNPVKEEDKAEYHRMDDEEEKKKQDTGSGIDDKLIGTYKKNDDEINEVMKKKPVEMPEEEKKKGPSIEELAEIEEEKEDED